MRKSHSIFALLIVFALITGCNQTNNTKDVIADNATEVVSNTSKDVKANTTNKIPTSTLENTPMNTSEGVTKSTSREMQNSTPKEVMTKPEKEVNTSTPKEVMTKTLNEVKTSTSREVTASAPNEEMTKTANEVKTSASKEVPISAPNEVLSNTSKDVPAKAQQEVFTDKEAASYAAEQKAAQEAQKNAPNTIKMEIMQSGRFKGIAPGHDSKGTVTIKENGDQVIIEINGDFVTDRGPDLYVALSQKQTLSGRDPVKLDKNKVYAVSSLAKQIGSQMYTVSKKDFEANDYAVIIWCQRFNVLFGAAVLN